METWNHPEAKEGEVFIGNAEPSEERKLAQNVQARIDRKGKRISPGAGLFLVMICITIGIYIEVTAVRLMGLTEFELEGFFCGGMGGLFIAIILMSWKKWI